MLANDSWFQGGDLNYLYLTFHVTAPIFGPVVLLLLFNHGSMQKRVMELFSLNSRESLVRQRLFWLCLIIPIAMFFSFGIISWDGYQVDLTQNGISLFWTISTFPLALLSAAIPLGAVVASFHSTQQTAEQIREASIKNKIEAYYLHRTEFFNHFERHESVNYLGVLEGRFVPHPLLYNNCSPGEPGDGSPKKNEKYFNKIDADFESAAMFLHTLFGDEYSEILFNVYLCNACVCVYRISERLGLSEIYRGVANNSLLVEPPRQPGQEIVRYLTLGTSAADIVAAYRYARDFYVNLGAFYGYEVPELAPHLKYLESGGKVFDLPGWSNVAKFRDDLMINYVGGHKFKVTKSSEIMPEEIGMK